MHYAGIETAHKNCARNKAGGPGASSTSTWEIASPSVVMRSASSPQWDSARLMIRNI